jgi:hypothetical protein
MVWGLNSSQARYFSFFIYVHTGSRAHPTSYSMGIGVPPYSLSAQGVMLTTHLYLAPRLRKTGAIPLLYLYAFMVWPQRKLQFFIQN